ncbi:hypothetical protein DPPLL_16810 [Desulfofustis limnaeus]|uniref:Uncharacterized protein n=1 Tax=Desulfofustis limnaeus TaxID=2740163 RepID=A0ABM7W8L0_9BACT|nr:hypothetical protein DPPLL_16810 [Desulfofustis limnaeus]
MPACQPCPRLVEFRRVDPVQPQMHLLSFTTDQQGVSVDHRDQSGAPAAADLGKEPRFRLTPLVKPGEECREKEHGQETAA